MYEEGREEDRLSRKEVVMPCKGGFAGWMRRSFDGSVAFWSSGVYDGVRMGRTRVENPEQASMDGVMRGVGG
jgi:hypothetical protein